MTTAATTRPMPRGPAQRPDPKPTTGPAVAFGKIGEPQGRRICLYGCGGSGKTSLACLAPPPVAFFDLDESLPVLRGQLPGDLDLRVVSGATTWQTIRDALHAPGWDGIESIAIDSGTRAEELACEWIVANVPHEKGSKVAKIGDYPYGAGYRHLYDEFLKLLGDLDQHVRAGRNVVIICHESTERHPNPQGEDFLRAEPRLQHSPKSSIRERIRDWCDALFYIAYDLDVQKGKAKGAGTRTIYPNELPSFMAKSRTLTDPLPLTKYDTTIWPKLLGL